MAVKSGSDADAQDMGLQGSSNIDERTMNRLGKAQELKRQFSKTALFGFVVGSGVSWQATLIGTLFSLPNGGPAGAIITYIIVAFGLTLTCLSLAEMASIAPTAGGQYHWVSELAPKSVQKPLSYMVGWTANYAWQVVLVSICNGVTVALQGVVALWKPGFHLTSWQQGLCVILLLCMNAGINLSLLDFLPPLEFVLLTTTVAAFVAFELVMLILGPRLTAREVFTDFENLNHWPTMAGAVLVGILGATSSLTNADSSAHMAEELQDAAIWLPRVLIGGQVLNYTIGFLMLLTFLFRATDIPHALKTNPSMPWVAIMENITGSRAATAVMAIYFLLAVVCGTINISTTSSRQLYAFARDRGIPFSDAVCKVSPRGVPRNAILTTLGFNVLLAIILMGSSIAFHIIAGLGVIFLFASYMMSIGTAFYRRCQGPLPDAPFSLGIWGFPINFLAVVFCLFTFVLLFFPPAPDPSLADMNWTCVVFVSLELAAVLLYVVHQRHVYIGPVDSVRELCDEKSSPEQVKIQRY